MCVNKDNTNPEDFVKFHEFVMTLDPEQPFTQLLNALGIMLDNGGTICLAAPGQPEPQQAMPQGFQPSPQPGIYPPNTFQQGDDGTGQYL